MLTHASMPKSYWSYAFTTATYLINRLPTPNLSMESPFQKLFGEAPNYSQLRVFGCLCFSWLRPYTSHKLEDRSTPCVFIGYSQTQSAYLCLQPSTGRIYVSRHVKFDETRFPFKTSSSSSQSIHPQPTQIPTPPSSNSHPVTIVPTRPTPPDATTNTTASPLVSPPLTGFTSSDSHRTVDSTSSLSSPTVRSTENSPTETTASPNQAPALSPTSAQQLSNPSASPSPSKAQSENQAQNESPTSSSSELTQRHQRQLKLIPIHQKIRNLSPETFIRCKLAGKIK